MNTRTFGTAVLSFIILLSFSAVVVHAQTQGAGNSGAGTGVSNVPPGQQISTRLENPFKVGDNLVEVLAAIFHNVLLPIGGVVAVLAFIWAGFKFVMAQGNPGEIKQAKAALLYTAIGVAVLFAAEIISRVIQGTLSQLQ